jgi:cytochrome c553
LAGKRGIHLLLLTVLALGVWLAAHAEEGDESFAPEEALPAPIAPPVEPPVATAAPMPVGNLADGKRGYAVCAVCHLENGAGRPDGVFPQLAGQHASVTYRQITDIRDGRRDNPIMAPFAMTLTDPQDLADLAAYIESLPLPLDNGKGPGNDYALGATLYERDCVDCHGERGQGNAERLVPVVAGQHYAYLARQIDDIAGRHRRNSDPKMTGVVTTYSERERQAVADYISRLEEAELLVPAPEAGGEVEGE